MFQTCPKCGTTLEPAWHPMCKNNKKAVKQMINTSNEEHMHYFCKCGYDFIVPIKDETV